MSDVNLEYIRKNVRYETEIQALTKANQDLKRHIDVFDILNESGNLTF